MRSSFLLASAVLALACSGTAKPDVAAAAGGGDTPSSRGSSAGESATGTAGAASGAGAGGASTATAGRGANDGGSGAAPGGAGATAGSAGSTAGGAAWSAEFPTFIKHTIASFAGGYATAVADIDHDGKPDVVALSSGAAGLVWFKNPGWEKYTITTSAKQLIYMAPYDIDGDGDLDLALISDFNMNDTTGGGTVSWAEAPSDPTQSQAWELHAIGAIPTSHRLRFADLDGDGKKELLDLPLFGEGSSGQAHAGAVKLTAFAIPLDPKGAWSSKLLDGEHLEVAHALEIVDFDGDGAEDVLTAANDGVELFRPALGANALHLAVGEDGQAPNRGSSEVALGSLGGARFLATIEPWHGTDLVMYTPGAAATEPWSRRVLGSDFQHGHGMARADFNADGFDEVVAGGGEGTMAQLIYRYVPSTAQWDKIELDLGGVAVSGLAASDLNADGAIDIVSIGGTPTNNVVWYESSGRP